MRWWGPQDDDDIDETIDRSEPEVTVLLMELAQPDVSAPGSASPVIGVIQFHEEEDPMYRHAGIDIAIHDDHQRKGYGTEAIRLVVDHLFSIGHHRIVIDPNAANQAAIAAYAGVGFSPVGTMGQYEWSEHEQRWTDGLLMELLANP
jgi:aminoglycoside 6'-N-acetyltransferase